MQIPGTKEMRPIWTILCTPDQLFVLYSWSIPGTSLASVFLKTKNGQTEDRHSGIRELIQKINKLKYGFRPNFWLFPPPPMFGSKNRYQSPDTISIFVFQYYNNEYQRSLDLGFDPPPPLDKFQTFIFLWMISLIEFVIDSKNMHLHLNKGVL